MASFTSMPYSEFSQDEIWDNLKQAIATSSGFKRWHAERSISNVHLQDLSQDQLVSLYLRETLETLAY